ncbi:MULTISPECIES: oxygenase MpaB family protein [unclassified Pseudomonas]|uniref:oxygenase MpaB family protein n=1 Tax=unclassified Pseudomonas TaxID=196821 RepID=UPI000BD1F560|nr:MULTISPECIES: oxygenase MpaB family protein [unclassified Pseudomonas]PVZ12573.1 uncharacterized protein (DUF2236 family) [Pseudomonas sp. URIL14HWK12:I12]PVZ23275.1 uncharacterized protein (DUF2236 family) [Pseudomonas sp. URIL14HWK12:I10]PVZ32605.1 uncharacterized protein (DUF2236 family) [Pseudomonas sp. URIL14HWK12:I11]SNZ13759.1 Uncharacterized conserved protein, DUF2236 family [Pseudomonas sp. URIL14HWK12:I9]
MEALRRRLESQVMALTGLSLGQLDLDNPPGDPGLFGPGAAPWQVHRDFPSMMIGGISALMLQMLHPLALAGVWDHSNFRQDMLGRLRRTSQFIAGTTFGSTHDANWLIDKVVGIHRGVTGTAPDGRPYAASDPALLTWVHVAEVSQFLAAHLRYVNPEMPATEQDRYYDEIALIATRLGATQVPRSRAQVTEYLEQQRAELVCDSRCREVVRLLLNAPSPSHLVKPAGQVMIRAGVDLLPSWARAQLGLSPQPAAHYAARALAPVLRWAVRNGSYTRACRRLGLGDA